MKGITNSIQYFPVKANITTMPTTLSYSVGDTLDTSGIVVKMAMDNGATENPTSLSYSVPSGDITNLQATDTTVTVSAKFNNRTVTTSYGITVTSGVLVTLRTEGSSLTAIDNKFGTTTSSTNTGYAYIEYAGTTHATLSETFYASVGSSIVFNQVGTNSSSSGQRIYLNETRVASNTGSRAIATYTYTVPNNISNIYIDLTVTNAYRIYVSLNITTT